MSSAGFVNYPTESWHWSYRDRYGALVTGAPAAAYGPVHPMKAYQNRSTLLLHAIHEARA